MGSSHFGDQQMGNGGCGSRKGKSKGGSEKQQKQPQRGLGVAQLEKLRLQNEMMVGFLPSSLAHRSPFPSSSSSTDHLNKEDLGVVQTGYPASPPSSSTATSSSSSSSSSYSVFGAHTNIMMGFGGSSTGTELRSPYVEHYPGAASRSSVRHNYFLQPSTTLPLIDQNMENNRRQDRHHSMSSIGQNSDLSSSSELDLELRLSL